MEPYKEGSHKIMTAEISDNANLLKVEILEFSGYIWKGLANFVKVRTLVGDLGIMPGHVPILGVMNTGNVLVKSTDNNTYTFKSSGGFLSLDNNIVRIIVDSVEKNTES